jgi:matrixin
MCMRRTLVLLILVLSVGYDPVSTQRLLTLEPLDAAGRVTYFIAEGEAGSTYRPADRDLALWALKAWERSVGGALRFEPSDEESALVRVYWVAANAGQYGEMRPLSVKGLRGAAVYIRPDTTALGDEIARLARLDALFRDTIVYLTCVHELGHAMGLAHTSDFRDIMYFFGYGGDIPGFFNRYRTQLKVRGDIAGVSGLSSGDAERVRALYARR